MQFKLVENYCYPKTHIVKTLVTQSNIVQHEHEIVYMCVGVPNTVDNLCSKEC